MSWEQYYGFFQFKVQQFSITNLLFQLPVSNKLDTQMGIWDGIALKSTERTMQQNSKLDYQQQFFPLVAELEWQ